MMTGAPVLIGMSAIRAGADVVYFAGPERAMNVVANYFPTFISLPLKGDFLDESSLSEIFSFAKDMRITSLAIGPGLWRNKRTKKTVVKIIDGFEVPIVADADAVRALSEYKRIRDLLKRKNIVLTPHTDEFHDLTGVKLSTNLQERIKAVKNHAKNLNATIVLKGHIDVISNGEKTAINKTGNAFMSKGGFGDTLTGICAALISRKINKLDSFTAACAATYINGRAGDIAAKKSREGLLVTEMIDAIPEVIRRG